MRPQSSVRIIAVPIPNFWQPPTRAAQFVPPTIQCDVASEADPEKWLDCDSRHDHRVSETFGSRKDSSWPIEPSP